MKVCVNIVTLQFLRPRKLNASEFSEDLLAHAKSKRNGGENTMRTGSVERSDTTYQSQCIIPMVQSACQHDASWNELSSNVPISWSNEQARPISY